MSPAEVFFVVIQLIFLEGILSIDNAAVLGAMVSVLPSNEPIPWPPALHGMQRWGDRVLGGQRAAALKVGLLGAYLGRGLMLFFATFIIRNPWLRLLGALYLFKLSISHLGGAHAPHSETDDDPTSKVTGKTFWSVVVAVELADLAFSLDNVVAAVALSDKFWVVMLGVALGIVTMRFAAQLFTVMIEREPVLVPTAYILVFNISLELIVAEVAAYMGHEIHIASWQKFAISILTIVLALTYAHVPFLQRLSRPVLRLVALLFRFLDSLLDILLLPVKWLLSGLMIMGRALYRQMAPDKASKV